MVFVFKATMICVDDSAWMRNQDYRPSRFLAQKDAINSLIHAELWLGTLVGVLTMAGKRVRVLSSPTRDHQELANCTEGLKIGDGEIDLIRAIRTAHLVLDHCQERTSLKRIVAFAGSPVRHDGQELAEVGRMLREKNIALDIVDFGEDDDGKLEKLRELVTAAKKDDSSHIVRIPPGPRTLCIELYGTPVFKDWMDPDENPEHGPRVWMEENRGRQQGGETEEMGEAEQRTGTEGVIKDAVTKEAHEILTRKIKERRRLKRMLLAKKPKDQLKIFQDGIYSLLLDKMLRYRYISRFEYRVAIELQRLYERELIEDAEDESSAAADPDL